MSGEELYRMYIEEQNNRNTMVDSWGDLGETEQEVWCAMAYRISNAC